MELNISLREAQHRVYGYFNETLRELPAEVHLSNRPDNDRLAIMSNNRALAMPCWDGNIQTEGPHYIDIAYWIVGLPSGGTRKYFERIPKIWKSKGWEEVDRDETYVAVRTPDGFGLALQDAGKGDGSLSLSGFSPCVPQEAEDSREDLPEVFPHP